MTSVNDGVWTLIASMANEPEVEEIAGLIGVKRIKDNEVSLIVIIDLRILLPLILNPYC